MPVWIIVIASMLVSCAWLKKDNEPEDTLIIPNYQDLKTQKEVYLSASIEQADSYGFVHGGDGMLFSCLRFAAGGNVKWKESHKSENNYWMIRHPGYEPNTSSDRWSWYSKDMLVGELICVWKARDLSWLESRIEWLEDNDWDACGGRDYADPYATWKSRCKVSWNLKDTIYEMRKRLGGDGHPITWIPQIWNPYDLEDYTSHLTVLSILLRGVMMGGINDYQLKYLKDASEFQDYNALYLAVYRLFSDGDMTDAVKVLRDTAFFPMDSLPTSSNYCTNYLFQRDQNNSGDWNPCPDENKTHDGTDWLFAATVALGEFY